MVGILKNVDAEEQVVTFLPSEMARIIPLLTKGGKLSGIFKVTRIGTAYSWSIVLGPINRDVTLMGSLVSNGR